MSMSTDVIGFIPFDDEKFTKMRLIYYACLDQGIPIPKEVNNYFNDREPDDNGLIIELSKDAIKEWCRSEYAQQGIEVDLTKIPKNIKILRFYNSW